MEETRTQAYIQLGPGRKKNLPEAITTGQPQCRLYTGSAAPKSLRLQFSGRQLRVTLGILLKQT